MAIVPIALSKYQYRQHSGPGTTPVNSFYETSQPSQQCHMTFSTYEADKKYEKWFSDVAVQ